MPRKGENIYKRADGRWEGRYINGRDELTGKARYGYVYARSYNEVKRLKAQAEVQARRPVNRGVTVEECLARWLEEKRADPSIHATTLDQYARHINKHLNPTLGAVRLCRLTGEVIHRFRLRQLNSGRLDGTGGLSATVVDTQLLILNSMLGWAVRNGLLQAVPEPVDHKRAKENRRVRVLDRQEQARLESAVRMGLETGKQVERGLYLGVMFSLYTGLRVGELGGLQWRDLSMDPPTVSVRHTLQRLTAPEGSAQKTQVRLGPPKTEASRRSCPMMAALGKLMGEYADGLPKDRVRPHDPVFTYRDKPIEPRLFQKFFKRLLEQAGVEDANFHTLRHTFATRCLEKGMDMQSLSELLGHADSTITARRYAHSLVQHKTECLNRLQFTEEMLA